MDNGIDDERDFWHDEPTRRLARQRVPVVATPNRLRRRPTDPMVVRLAVIVGLGAAMVPVAFTLRNGADDVLRDATARRASSATIARPLTASSVVTTQAPAQVLATAPAATLAIDVASTTTQFDIDALPPAIPVNTAARTTAEPAPTAPPPPAPTTVAATAAPPSAAPVTAAVAQPLAETPVRKVVCAKSYPVVSGDYWIVIADRVKVTVTELLAANNATAATPLYPGRSVCLPQHASSLMAVSPATTAAPASTATPTTAKPVVTTAAPTTTLPARTYSVGEVEAIIRAVWPDELEDEAVRIARRESNLRPTARNACCSGLFQIYYSVHRGWLGAIGITSAEQLLDPRSNATAAYTLYQRSGGWGPWTI